MARMFFITSNAFTLKLWIKHPNYFDLLVSIVTLEVRSLNYLVPAQTMMLTMTQAEFQLIKYRWCLHL